MYHIDRRVDDNSRWSGGGRRDDSGGCGSDGGGCGDDSGGGEQSGQLIYCLFNQNGMQKQATRSNHFSSKHNIHNIWLVMVFSCAQLILVWL